MLSKKKSYLFRKKKATKKQMKGAGASKQEIREFIQRQLTKEKLIKDKLNPLKFPRTITPANWVWSLLENSAFFNNKYLMALSEMQDKKGNPTYRRENITHREFEEIQKQKQDFYLMNIPQEQQKALISTKKEFFYDKSPQELYAWWLSKQEYMDRQGYKTIADYPLNDIESKTEPILSIIEVVIVNCMTHIINSYIKYGEKEREEEDALNSFFQKINDLYQPGSNYRTLYEFITAYAEWDYKRIILTDRFSKELRKYDLYKNTHKLLFEDINNSKLFYLPMSTAINYKKSVYMYTIPVLYFSIVNEIGHGRVFDSYGNINHDCMHNRTLISIYVNDKQLITTENLITVYTLVTDFFMKIHDYFNHNQNKEDEENIFYILFSYLHELSVINQYDEDLSADKEFYLPLEFYVKMITNIKSLLDDNKLEILKKGQKRPINRDYKITDSFSSQLDFRSIICNLSHQQEMLVTDFFKYNQQIKSWLDDVYSGDNQNKYMLIKTEKNPEKYFDMLAEKAYKMAKP